jgi:hypothetical protein
MRGAAEQVCALATVLLKQSIKIIVRISRKVFLLHLAAPLQSRPLV